MGTAYFSQAKFREHENYPGHPERPARLDAIDAALLEQGLWDRLIHPEFAAADEDALTACHAPGLVEGIKCLAEAGGGSIDPDTHVTPASYEVATLAAGAALHAVDAVVEQRCRNAFVAPRPPGHHAQSNRSMGFCLFNNIACAARHAQRRHNLTSIAILDWDVHHGNGTQEIFYEDASVLFVSVHEWQLFPRLPYPITGSREEHGRGAGLGFTVNFPLPANSGGSEYSEVWEQVGQHVAEFGPELILVSAGYDAHRKDPLGGMRLDAEAFAHLTRTTKRWADHLCDGRLICLLEGGYSLSGLADSVAATIQELLAD